MSTHLLFNNRRNQILMVFGIVLFMVSTAYCGSNEPDPKGSLPEAHKIQFITSENQLNDILAKAGPKLVMLDFYAVWCSPCRMIAPILEDIASLKKDRVSIYKINVDKNKNLASKFRVRGIPVMIFFKNQKQIYKLYGLQSKREIVETINRLAGKQD